MAASGSKARMTGDGRSAGGKIVRRRRTASTPYDRPPSPSRESPNWFKGLVSPAKTVAGKLLSSFWNPDTWASSSSSSSSDTDSQPVSEAGVEDDSDHYEFPYDGVELNEKNVTSSGMIKSFNKDSQLTGKKSEVKHLIEQLLMHENFSRAESDRLIAIISSRVVDEGFEAGPSVIPCGGTDNGTDICCQAVVEAKKWLEEKKVGSSLKSNFVVKQHVRENEVGSPVDVAKSYMLARPLWASPIKLKELQSPLAVATKMFTEATPSLNRDSFSAGSWNIQEEIRKLRSKATEDMLRTRPSSKLDLASFTPDHKTTLYSSIAGQSVELMNSLGPTDVGKTQDGSCADTLPSYPPLLIAEQNQDLEATQTAEGEGVAFQSHHASHPDVESGQDLDTDPRLSDRNCAEVDGVTEFKAAPNGNGSATSQLSLDTDVGMEHKPGQADEGNPSPSRSCYNQLADIIPVDGICELSTETSVDLATVDEAIVNGSKSSSRMPNEEQPTCENQKVDSVGNIGSMIEKQVGKKPGRYVRKGRARAK